MDNKTQVQVKISISPKLNELIKLKAEQVGIPVTQFIKYLIIKEFDSNTLYPSIDTEKKVLKALKEIQDIENIGKIAKKNNVLFHVDAMQSLKYLDIDVNKFNIDLLTFGAHKINGPKGIGALYIKRGTPIQALIKGGSQEYRIRGGTENLSAIVGFGEAVELLKSEKYKRQEYVKTLRDNFERDILKINGTKLNSNASNRMPHLSNILFDKINSESMLIQLDLYNISASAGSACSSLSIEPSHVLTSIGLTEKEAKHSIRFSLGHENTQIEIEKTIQVIKEILNKYE